MRLFSKSFVLFPTRVSNFLCRSILLSFDTFVQFQQLICQKTFPNARPSNSNHLNAFFLYFIPIRVFASSSFSLCKIFILMCLSHTLKCTIRCIGCTIKFAYKFSNHFQTHFVDERHRCFVLVLLRAFRRPIVSSQDVDLMTSKLEFSLHEFLFSSSELDFPFTSSELQLLFTAKELEFSFTRGFVSSRLARSWPCQEMTHVQCLRLSHPSCTVLNLSSGFVLLGPQFLVLLIHPSGHNF